MRAATYVRALGPERGQEEYILEDQRSRIERYLAEQGWDLAGVYEDAPSRSAQPSDRPGLGSLMGELEQLDKVVVTALYRIMPSARAALDLVRQLRRSGVDLVSLDEGFD